MKWQWIIFWISVLMVRAVWVTARRLRLRPFFSRSCAGRQWRQGFPLASKADIRSFLEVFVDSFALPRRHGLKFRPADRIMDVYRTINPRGAPDALELETLSLELERRYQLRLESFWRDDLTIGEVFGTAVLRGRSA